MVDFSHQPHLPVILEIHHGHLDVQQPVDDVEIHNDDQPLRKVIDVKHQTIREIRHDHVG